MKKGVSISLLVLMLATLFHLSVATHYCGGKIAASKISLTGKMASCGMECSEKPEPFTGTVLTGDCCDDVVVCLTTNNNYLPSACTAPESYNYNFQDLIMHEHFHAIDHSYLKPLFHSISPPGIFGATQVNLPAICVFRI